MFPILQVLADEGGPLPFKTIVERALGKMGLDVHCMDPEDMDPKDTPRVYQRFANGGFELRQKGCIPKGSRTWTITERGREALRTGKLPAKLGEGEAVEAPPKPSKSGPNATPNPESENVSEARPKAPTPEKLPKGDEWAADPYLSKLIAGNTPCFGTYEAGHKVCGSCLLRRACGGALAGALSALAQGIKSDSEKRPLMKPKALKELRETAANALASTDPKAIEYGKTFGAPYDGVCAKTGEEFKAGDPVQYDPGLGLFIPAA